MKQVRCIGYKVMAKKYEGYIVLCDLVVAPAVMTTF